MTLHETVTEYTISTIPEDNINRSHFEIKVVYRGRGLWAVMDGPYCLDADGDWDYELTPSDRTEGWLTTHRFTEQTALHLAREAPPHMTVNGLTVADVLARGA